MNEQKTKEIISLNISMIKSNRKIIKLDKKFSQNKKKDA